MTNYDDGQWHGWNGGECPVHPKSEVSFLSTISGGWVGAADSCDWTCFRGAFRVVKPYQEPREGWAVRLFSSAHEAKIAFPGSEPFKVREVTE